ncbi:MocR-like pyridoxine biosynthesis transcription factor PdxR [Oleiphilus messinensis]|nr:PLP-dependent aminotransferase family protein [Oleiphilus messinensis]
MAKTQQRFQFDALVLHPEDGTALYRQLESQIRDAIWKGLLQPGERLPSTRNLAHDLGVARNTVVNAYEQLMLEGFIVSIKGAGTCVSENLPQSNASQSTSFTVSSANKYHIPLSSRYQCVESNTYPIPLDAGSVARPFRAHTPACAAFPIDIWKQLYTRRLRHMPESWMEKNDPIGYQPLRIAIASHLGAARSVSAIPDQVLITAGAQQGIELIAKALINKGDVVCFEEPGYTPAKIVFEMMGAVVKSIPVDDQGIRIDILENTVKQAKLVYVTPSSHFPLGIPLSLSRRKALLQWAERSGAIILEDDYNGEYRYRGRPLATLYSMAQSERVIYMGSFSKLLFPALRIGYMVIPPMLVKPLAALRWLSDRHSPVIEQAVLTDFIDQGHFARHLRRMRTLYSHRQLALVEAAELYWSDIMEVPPLHGGLHLIGWLKPAVQVEKVLIAAKLSGVELVPVSQYGSIESARAGVILGYVSFTLAEINAAVKKLRAAYFEKPIPL